MKNFSQIELERYARHLSLPEVGLQGQQRLKEAKVLCVGAGGLGCPALLYLAAAGVGTIGIVDFDQVELSNLQRQVLFTTSDVGKSKASAARERLLALNPDVQVNSYPTKLTADNALSILGDYDIVIDATDNYAARYLINDACFHLKKPDIFACILRFSGQCTVFTMPGQACYRCIFPDPPSPEYIPNCAEAGVLGILPGLLGCLQAVEAIKIILNIGNSLAGRILTVDTLAFRWQEISLSQNPECILCAKNTPFAQISRPNESCQSVKNNSVPEITIAEFKQLRTTKKPFFLLDVREPSEYEEENLNGYLIPLKEISQRMHELDAQQMIVVHCAMGGRSMKAVELLQKNGFKNVFNLKGGIVAWLNEQKNEKMQSLPRLFMITGADPRNQESFLQKLNNHLSHGIKLIQLRAKELPLPTYIALAEKALTLARPLGAKIILNSDPQTAMMLDADGLHLTSHLLLSCSERPLAKNKIVSAACHNLEQLQHAEKIGVDFVTLSPVAATATHPNALPLGWDTFSKLCQSVHLPVFALGGMSDGDLNKVLSCGGYGIAAIGALWEKVWDKNVETIPS